MDWITGMQRAIDYIEAHITEELDYEAIAKESFSSAYHFQRVFSILCGYTLGEYIRNRRLTLAGAELQSIATKVLDVALKYGYDSPDSFAKAFQKFHGMTPSQARSSGKMLRSFSRLSIKIILEGGSEMKYRIEERAEQIFTGFKRHFEGAPEERVGQEHEFYVHTRPQQYLLQGLSEDPFTICDVVTNLNDEGFDLYIGEFLPESRRTKMHKDTLFGEEIAGWFEHLTIPAHTYAVFETEYCKYPTNLFLDLRKRIVSEWLPSSGYQLSDAQEISVIHWYRSPRQEERYIELWMPIEKV